MDTPNDNPPLEPRLPDTDDLLFLCRRLNEAGAKYIVVGGFAGTTEVPETKLTREAVLKTLGISRNELYDLFFKKS